MSLTVKHIGAVDAGPDDVFEPTQREVVKYFYGRGSISAQLESDRVCLGDAKNLSMCARTKFATALKMSSEPFEWLPVDGILGLGVSDRNIPSESFNFLSNLIEK